MSVLTYRWQLENTIQRQYKQVNAHHDDRICNMKLMPKFHKISIDSIQQYCLIEPFKENSQFIMQVNEPTLLANFFLMYKYNILLLNLLNFR